MKVFLVMFESDYGYTDNLSMEGWAWEFLRRSPDYIDDYNRIVSQIKKFKNEYGEEWRKHPDTRVYKPAKNLDEEVSEWSKRVAMEGCASPEIEDVETVFMKQWCLGGVYSPSKQYNSGIKFVMESKMPKKLSVATDINAVVDFEEQGDAQVVCNDQSIFVFDMTFPLKEQLRDVSQYLYEQQSLDERSVRSRKEAWKTYLKILDVECSNPKVTKIELGKLCGYKQTDNAYSDAGYKSLKRARDMQSRYRLLASGVYKD